MYIYSVRTTSININLGNTPIQVFPLSFLMKPWGIPHNSVNVRTIRAAKKRWEGKPSPKFIYTKLEAGAPVYKWDGAIVAYENEGRKVTNIIGYLHRSGRKWVLTGRPLTP